MRGERFWIAGLSRSTMALCDYLRERYGYPSSVRENRGIREIGFLSEEQIRIPFHHPSAIPHRRDYPFQLNQS